MPLLGNFCQKIGCSCANPGPQGPPGPQGATGAAGAQGPAGPAGPAGKYIYLRNELWNGTGPIIEGNPNNQWQDGDRFDGGVTCPSDKWGIWQVVSGGVMVTGGYVSSMVFSQPAMSSDPNVFPGWAVDGYITITSTSVPNDVEVFAYATFWAPAGTF